MSMCCLAILPAIERFAETTMISIGNTRPKVSHDGACSWPCVSPGHTLVIRATEQSFDAHGGVRWEGRLVREWIDQASPGGTVSSTCSPPMTNAGPNPTIK